MLIMSCAHREMGEDQYGGWKDRRACGAHQCDDCARLAARVGYGAADPQNLSVGSRKCEPRRLHATYDHPSVVRPRHGLDSPCHARSRIVKDLACVPCARHARPCTVRPDAQRVMAQIPSGTVLVLATWQVLPVLSSVTSGYTRLK